MDLSPAGPCRPRASKIGRVKETELALGEATPLHVARRLSPYPLLSTPLDPPWADIVSLYGGGSLGEVRDARDWEAFPLIEQLRVMAFRRRKGIWVVRWATDEGDRGASRRPGTRIVYPAR